MGTTASVDDAKCDTETNSDEIANGDEDDDDDNALNSCWQCTIRQQELL